MQKPFPNGRILCPTCNSILIAKCGELNIWHWAHENKEECDNWNYEPKTQWHIEWQSNFKTEQIERYLNKNNQIHIADILTSSNVVIEIQNSPISNIEIAEREEFYNKMIWVINSKEFKHNLSLKKFKYDFDLEVTKNEVNYNPEIASRGIEIKLINYDYNGQIEKALINCNYKKEENSYIDENGDEYEYETDEIVYYKNRTKNEEELEKEIKNAFYSNLLDNKIIQNLDKTTTTETTFSWKHFRKSWLIATKPIFIDLNNRYLLYIKTIHENGNGFGLVLSKKKFLKKYTQ